MTSEDIYTLAKQILRDNVKKLLLNSKYSNQNKQIQEIVNADLPDLITDDYIDLVTEKIIISHTNTFGMPSELYKVDKNGKLINDL